MTCPALSDRGRGGPATDGECGFALIIVLWTTVLLALLASSLLAAARSDAKLATNRRDEAVAVAAADGAISATILDLLRSGSLVSGGPAFAPIGAHVGVAIENLSGRLNPNVVSAAMLRALLMRLGVPPQPAENLAAAIVDWRSPGQTPSPHGAKEAAYRTAGLDYGPPGRPFEQIGELAGVLGMTQAVLQAMAPHLTLWSSADPDPGHADALILDAMRASGSPIATPSSDAVQVIAITATATLPDAPHVVRRAVVRFGASPDGRGWRVLSWDGGDAPG